jgi:hypothetical protein
MTDEQKAQLYADAQAKVALAVSAMEQDYRPHAIGIVEILHKIAVADEAVRAANAALPAGQVPLNEPEMIVRRKFVSANYPAIYSLSSTVCLPSLYPCGENPLWDPRYTEPFADILARQPPVPPT